VWEWQLKVWCSSYLPTPMGKQLERTLPVHSPSSDNTGALHHTLAAITCHSKHHSHELDGLPDWQMAGHGVSYLLHPLLCNPLADCCKQGMFLA